MARDRSSAIKDVDFKGVKEALKRPALLSFTATYLSGQKIGTSSMTMAKTAMVRTEPTLTKSKKR